MRTVFVAYNPKSSEDYQPQEFSEETTYHWNSECTWGEGFDSKEEATDDYWKTHDVDEDDDPEILEIGSEWDGILEQVSNGTKILDPEDFANLCVEEAEEKLESAVFFQHCQRGFANEVSFVAVEADRAENFRGEDGYEELTREQLTDNMIYGAESHACDVASGVNTHQNPSCGSYGIEII